MIAKHKKIFLDLYKSLCIENSTVKALHIHLTVEAIQNSQAPPMGEEDWLVDRDPCQHPADSAVVEEAIQSL